jgi:hypothetical protein
MVEKKRDKRFRLTTPYGHISARKQQPEFKYDKDSLLTWLKDREYKQYIDAKEEPKWVDFKKSLTLTEDGTKAISADGEIIDIIEVQQRDDKVSVEVV